MIGCQTALITQQIFLIPEGIAGTKAELRRAPRGLRRNQGGSKHGLCDMYYVLKDVVRASVSLLPILMGSFNICERKLQNSCRGAGFANRLLHSTPLQSVQVGIALPPAPSMAVTFLKDLKDPLARRSPGPFLLFFFFFSSVVCTLPTAADSRLATLPSPRWLDGLDNRLKFNPIRRQRPSLPFPPLPLLFRLKMPQEPLESTLSKGEREIGERERGVDPVFDLHGRRYFRNRNGVA